MKSRSIEVLNVSGNLVSHYEVEDLVSLTRLIDGFLLAISGESLIELTDMNTSEIHNF